MPNQHTLLHRSTFYSHRSTGLLLYTSLASVSSNYHQMHTYIFITLTPVSNALMYYAMHVHAHLLTNKFTTDTIMLSAP